MIGQKLKSCRLYFLNPHWVAPHIHMSVDSQEWRTLPMNHYKSNLFSVEVPAFDNEVKFVFCERDKTKWINPSKQLSQPDTYVQEGASTNFVLKRPGEFIVLDGHLQQIQTIRLRSSLLMAINVDGILCGQQISLLNFNTSFLTHLYFSERVKLVYLTGRTFHSLFKWSDLLLPDYVVAQGGSKVFRHLPEVPTQFLDDQFELIDMSELGEHRQQLASQALSHFPKTSLQIEPCRISLILTANVLYQQKARLKTIESELLAAGMEINFVSHGATTYVDVTNLGTNKASSLRKIAAVESNFSLVGFGSGCNDLQFLQLCSKAVAPCNIDKLTLSHFQRLRGITLSKCAYADCILQYMENLIHNQSAIMR